MATDARAFVTEQIRSFLEKGPYRTAALLLTYPPTKPGMTCRIALGAAMKEADLDSAMDFIQLVKGLRRLADELELRIEGKVSLKQEIREGDVEEKSMGEKTVSYEVEEIDQVNEGRAVWIVKEDCIDSVEAAADSACALSKTTEHGRARVVRVTREVLTVFRDGKVDTSGR